MTPEREGALRDYAACRTPAIDGRTVARELLTLVDSLRSEVEALRGEAEANYGRSHRIAEEMVAERARADSLAGELDAANANGTHALAAIMDLTINKIPAIERERDSLAGELATLRAERDAATARVSEMEAALAKLGSVCAPPSVENEHIRYSSMPDTPEAQHAAQYIIESATKLLRAQVEAGPPEKRNRVSIGVSWPDIGETWTLTFARGEYDNAMEQQRDAARIARDEAYGRAAALREERDAAREEASRAWAVLTNRDWNETREPGSAIAKATEAMESRKRALAERASAEVELGRAMTRIREQTQRLIESFGANGPMNLEDAVTRAVEYEQTNRREK